ncbi:S-adenosylmethionine decarboxylase [Tsukamurella sp. 8F]|uniref:S-adenosylmethionine decarboxylase n=1 Tax=unclassified Tsukamurella TaxID=2633480 RepID=UPI0023B9B0FC|nr:MULTISPECIES: S-adenosylmethionine decarboxylase [unclassified Tsukamurella]MDF0528334.1 S-adenosylmethionine decarboxylase [Tsukamurella sp. 8J]MDF0586159.1 S-adenosylmethionine decarboxylase [Tsukamurella sp. 8F]
MRDLAPSITRQRLLLEGFFTVDVGEETVRDFLLGLPRSLDLRTYGEPAVFAPQGRSENGNEGFDAFIPLVDSGISLYVWQTQRFLSLIVFTCKAFDAAAAVRYTRDYFRMTETEQEAF